LARRRAEARRGAVHLRPLPRPRGRRGRGRRGGARRRRPDPRRPGCLAINAFRSVRDPRLFYIHSRWIDEAAFDIHAELPHTVTFLERVTALIDHPLDVTRTTSLDCSTQEV